MKKLMTILLTVMMMFSLVSVVSADDESTGDENKPTFTASATPGEDGVYSYSLYVKVEFPKGNSDNGRLYDIKGMIDDQVIYNYGGSYNTETDGSGANMNSFGRILYGVCGEEISVTFTVYDGYSMSDKAYSETYKIKIDESEALFELNGHKYSDIYGGYEISNGFGGYSNYTFKLLKDYDKYLTYMPNNVTIDMNGHNLTLDNTYDMEFSVINSGNDGKLIFKTDDQLRFNSDVTKYIPDGFEIVKYTYPTGDVTYYCVKEGTSPEIFYGATGEDFVGVTNDVANSISAFTGNENFDANNVATIDSKLENVESSITSDDKNTIETKAKEVLSDGKVSKYLDLTLTAKDSNGNEATITELSKETEVTIYLSDETNDLLKGKEVEVVRLHNNVAEKVDSKYDEENQTLTITSDKFSIYAIVTKEKATSSGSTVTRTEANTPCEDWHKSKNWTWSESEQQCVYRVINTSAK